MWNRERWTAAVVVLVAGFGLAACGESLGAEANGSGVKPAKVEKVDGSDTARVTVTEEAAKRLDIQTTAVRDQQVAGQARKVIPYAAVLYDAKGQAWTFTTAEPLTFIRQRISIVQITGSDALLSEGPAAGTNVVTVGAQELYGAELGVGK